MVVTPLPRIDRSCRCHDTAAAGPGGGLNGLSEGDAVASTYPFLALKSQPWKVPESFWQEMYHGLACG